MSVENERGVGPCPDCDGQGWSVGIEHEDRCCGGSDWECGASGCTGPIQEQIPVQIPCERCSATGQSPNPETQHDR